MRYLLNILLLICFLSLDAYAQTADQYFHQSAQMYTQAKDQYAKKLLDEGLMRFPNDPKLSALREKIKEDEKKKEEEQKKKDQQEDDTVYPIALDIRAVGFTERVRVDSEKYICGDNQASDSSTVRDETAGTTEVASTVPEASDAICVFPHNQQDEEKLQRASSSSKAPSTSA